MPEVTVNQETASMRENLSDLIFVQVGPSILFLHLYLLCMYLPVLSILNVVKKCFYFYFILAWIELKMISRYEDTSRHYSPRSIINL